MTLWLAYAFNWKIRNSNLSIPLSITSYQTKKSLYFIFYMWLCHCRFIKSNFYISTLNTNKSCKSLYKNQITGWKVNDSIFTLIRRKKYLKLEGWILKPSGLEISSTFEDFKEARMCHFWEVCPKKITQIPSSDFHFHHHPLYFCFILHQIWLQHCSIHMPTSLRFPNPNIL